jgi:hypothetical protein
MKKTLKVAAVVLAAMIIAGFAFLIVVRGQFSAHLKEAYPGKTFSVGFVIVDPIYGNFVSKADCLDDYTNFTVSKSWNTKKISDNYPASKSQMQYNAMIGDIFEASPIIGEIESVTGGGKKPFDGSGNFDQINFHLADEKEHASDIVAILRILEVSGIEAQRIIFTYEMDKHVYVARLSSEDYGLSGDEIKSRIEMLK